MKSFKAEVRAGFKDEANVHGDFGKRLAALEDAVEKLDLKWRNGVLFPLLSSVALWTSMLNNYNKAVEPLLVKYELWETECLLCFVKAHGSYFAGFL